MMNICKLYLAGLLLLSGASVYAGNGNDGKGIDLSGRWEFCQGDECRYDDHVSLPGSMLTNGKGDVVSIHTRWTGSLYDSSYYFNPHMEKYRVEGQCKFPFFLTPERHYVGNAWYGRTVAVPRTWKGRRVFLHLERPHIETTVFINGATAGRDSSLSVPHEFELTPYIRYGADNRIDIRIYNGIENVCVGQDSHSVTDQTQGNWNGIVGDIRLIARPRTFIANVQVYPDIAAGSVEVEYAIDGARKPVRILTSVDGEAFAAHKATPDGNGKVRLRLPLNGELRLWDEFTPNLYTLTTVMGDDTLTTTFGLRDIKVKGRHILLNGREVWMRGTVGNCCFPLTGYPPTDVESWMAVFRQCKEYGLNFMRFHSYCPPEAAFVAADRVGFYLQPEGPSWPNHGVKLYQGMSIDRYLMEETQRMVRVYGNHPSFCMLAAGNEPAGDWVRWCVDWVNHWHATGDTRRLYCGASVGGGWAWDANSDYHVKAGARGLTWKNEAPHSMDDYYNEMLRPRNFKTDRVPAYALATDTLADGRVEMVNNSPIIAHEQGQWCAFPDLSERNQYTGVYKAGNFDIFADLLERGGMKGSDRRFLMASGRLQTLAYKYEIERNLRTPDYSGFLLLGLNDYSGQGTALVGVLNVFWREKGYCTAEEFREFCSPVVPLARFPRFVYTDTDTLTVQTEIYNAHCGTLNNVRCNYVITDTEGNRVAGGNLSSQPIPLGKGNARGTVTKPLAGLASPAKYTLTVSLTATDALSQPVAARNHWDFWVYPSETETSEQTDIYVTDTLDTQAIKTLEQGGKVLVTAAGRVTLGSDVVQQYLPVFWNTSWFKMRPPHTTGASIDTAHPLFRRFPTDDWANLNWWELLNRAQVMNLCELPADYRSPVQPIDTWHVSRKLGMVVEAQCLSGKLLITTLDISRDLDRRHVARQMRQAILGYMQSDDFRPSLRLAPEVITDFFTRQAPKVDMFTKDSPDELKPKLK